MTRQPASGPCLGVDIGGSKTQAIALDQSFRIVADRVRQTEPGPEGVVAGALAVARDCLRLAGMSTREVAGVGVGIPGRVDHRTGVVHTAVNLGVVRLELADRLSDALGVPVRVDNDVKATALGAADYLRAGDGDLTYINFGTGVSAATIAAGTLVRGAGNLAGEIGHLAVDPTAEQCACGQRGCIEVLAGGGWIAQRLAVLGPPVTLANLIETARTGDADAAGEACRIAGGIATAVQLAVLAHDSSRVVLGGGVIRTAPGLVDLTRTVLRERAGSSEFLASLGLPERVTVLPTDHPLAAIGAALVGAAQLSIRRTSRPERHGMEWADSPRDCLAGAAPSCGPRGRSSAVESEFGVWQVGEVPP